MLLFMLCSWIAVVTLAAVSTYFVMTEYPWGETFIVLVVISTLHTLFLLSTVAVNIYMFKKLRQLPQAANHQKSIHLRHKASILVLLLAVIMIVTCLPNSLLNTILSICNVYKLHCNLPIQKCSMSFISWKT